MRPSIKLPYLNLYRDRHGRWRAYYRRSGQRIPIPGDIGSAEFIAAYQKTHSTFEAEGKPRPGIGTFGHLLEKYYAAPEFRSLRDSTKEEYKRHLEPMRQKLGMIGLSGITKRVVLAYRDALQEQPAKANSAVRVMRTLLGFGVSREMLPANPASGVKALKTDGDGWAPWPESALAQFGGNDTQKSAKGASRIAFFLALYTGQRRADVLGMKWNDIVNGGINVKQDKTGAELWIPVHPALKAELDRARREIDERVERRLKKGRPTAIGLTIIQRANGAPLTDDGFGSIWNREQHRTECTYPFHGLRKNATARLFEAGCTPQQVQAITGHETLEMVQHYGKSANQKRLAKQAMDKLTAGCAGDGE